MGRTWSMLTTALSHFLPMRDNEFTLHTLVMAILSLLPQGRNRIRNLEISTAPTKAKLWESAYSQALDQNKIDRQRPRSRESGRQTDSQTAMVDGV